MVYRSDRPLSGVRPIYADIARDGTACMAAPLSHGCWSVGAAVTRCSAARHLRRSHDRNISELGFCKHLAGCRVLMSNPTFLRVERLGGLCFLPFGPWLRFFHEVLCVVDFSVLEKFDVALTLTSSLCPCYTPSPVVNRGIALQCSLAQYPQGLPARKPLNRR